MNSISTGDRMRLLDVAVRSVGEVFVKGREWTPDPAHFGENVRRPAATFVTLEDGDRLLGCIGALRALRPMVVDVARNAVAAAFADPRMARLTPTEYTAMSVKISVLSPMEPIAAGSIEQLAAAVRADEDGLVIRAGRRCGTLLPSVWPRVDSTEEFLTILWHKAGLHPGEWPEDLHVERYRTIEFGDPGPRELPATSAELTQSG